MKRALLLALAIAGLAVAGPKSYTVTLFQPALVGTTELKAGDYKLEVTDQKAVMKSGKLQAESAVKVETGNTKFESTSVRLGTTEGKSRVQEIRIGGTKTTVVFQNAGTGTD